MIASARTYTVLSITLEDALARIAMVAETRSQRHSYTSQQRPPYPQVQTTSSSSSSSAFQSCSNIASPSSARSSISVMTQQQAQQHNMPFGNSAPLPSPSAASSMQNYFTVRPQQPQSQPQHQQQQQQQQTQRQSQQQGTSYPGQRGDGRETAPFLQDFSLLAEAAKRAQMACLERDLGECGL